MARCAWLLLLAAACERAVSAPGLSSRRRALGVRGGGALDMRGGGTSAIARDFKKEISAGVMDGAVNFLEAPMFELSTSAAVMFLTVIDLTKEVRTLGYKSANWALFCLALSRCLKSLLTVLRTTSVALRGYKAYTVVHKGDHVFLRHIPETEPDPSAINAPE